jgi:hypothetical protein
MNRFGSMVKVSTVLAAIAWGTLLPAPAGSASAAVPQPRSWVLQTTPSNDNVVLDAVSCASAAVCLAVGTTTPPDRDGSPVVYRRHDGRWIPLPVPPDARGSDLAGIACPSAIYCIAVGGNPRGVAQAWSWDGSRWSEQPTYNSPSTRAAVLSGVECVATTSCEAVGVWFSPAYVAYPLVEHWNGRLWAEQPIFGASSGWLNSVSCESPALCEAVGYSNLRNGLQATLAVGLSRSRWTTQTTPGLWEEGDGYDLASVSCYPGGCTAVGYSQSGITLAETWSGRKWVLQTPVGGGEPSGTMDAEWNAIQCRSASSCTAVGAWDNGARPFLTLVDTWNGRMWATSRSPSPSPHGDELFGLSCAGTGSVCTAVGGSQTVSSRHHNASLAMSD